MRLNRNKKDRELTFSHTESGMLAVFLRQPFVDRHIGEALRYDVRTAKYRY